jgi:hypothetical protein
MDVSASDPRHDAERAPGQAFQAEGSEHFLAASPDEGPRSLTGPAAAYQHEDDEFVWPTD